MIKEIIFIKTLKNNCPKGQGTAPGLRLRCTHGWCSRSSGTEVLRKAPAAEPGWAGTPGTAGDRGTSSAVFPWHRARLAAVSPRADAARGRDRRAGKQHSTYSTCAPGSPDWCALLRGLVLEASSCACHRWYFYAGKQNQDIWWTVLSLQTAWSYRCKARSFMLELWNCEWNLKAVLNAYFLKFLNFILWVHVCVCVCNFAWSIYICITSLSSKLLWILLRWNNYCFGKLCKVLAALTAGLIYVHSEEEKDVLFKWVQLV